MLMGDTDKNRYLVGPFELYVGYSTDYTENSKCKDGPYLVDGYDPNLTYEWPAGVEVWCDLIGDYVSLVRDPSGIDLIPHVYIGSLGIIADLDTRLTIALESLGTHYSVT